jgi:dTDP-4-amino-4,6-dideoxygalactose transaminase
MFEKKFEKHFNLDVWYKSLFEGRTKNLHEIKYEKNSCPVAEHVSKHIVNLPTHLKIPQNMIDEIINKNWYWLKNNIDYNFRDRF